MLAFAILNINLYPLLTHQYSFILYLYTKVIWQYIRNLDVMDIFSTMLAYSCRRKNI